MSTLISPSILGSLNFQNALNLKPTFTAPLTLENPYNVKANSTLVFGTGFDLLKKQENELDREQGNKLVGVMKGLNSSIPSMGGLADIAFQIANSLIDVSNVRKTGAELAVQEGWNMGAKIAKNFGPTGMAIGYGMDAVNLLYNGATKLWAPKTSKFEKDADTIAAVGSGYGGTVSDFETASNDSGALYGFFNRSGFRKALDNINKSLINLMTMSRIADEKLMLMDRKGAMADINNNKYQNKLLGGYDIMTKAAKHGGTLNREVLDRVKQILLQRLFLKEYNEQYSNENYTPTFDIIDNYFIDNENQDLINSFKNGGAFNVIPEGALHARKNNMDIDGVTHKGIPVITEEENGVKQHAEIEVNEIILHLKLTKKLEELMKKYLEEDSPSKKTEIAVEAGKLLADEILNNTEDKTGLIEETNEV